MEGGWNVELGEDVGSGNKAVVVREEASVTRRLLALVLVVGLVRTFGASCAVGAAVELELSLSCFVLEDEIKLDKNGRIVYIS